MQVIVDTLLLPPGDLLMQGHLSMELGVDDLGSVQEWNVDLLEPKDENCEDFIKFVASLAHSVHVEAVLSHVTDPTSVNVQVGNIESSHDNIMKVIPKFFSQRGIEMMLLKMLAHS